MNKSDIKRIKDRLAKGERFFDKANKDKFERFKNFLKIKHYQNYADSSGKLVDKISVPIIHAIIRSKLPSLYYRNPTPLITPKKKMSPAALQTTLNNVDNFKAVMEYLPDEIDMEHEAKLTVLDMCAYGRGVMKVGFEFDMETSVAGQPTVLDQAKQAVTSIFNRSEGQFTTPDEQIKILIDRFFVKRVAYPTNMFIYDPDSVDGLRGARWCAEAIISPLSDVKANKNFSNTHGLKTNLKPKDTEKQDITTDVLGAEEDHIKYYFYWQKNQHGLVTRACYVVPDQDVVLKEFDKNPYDHGDWPYEELDNYTIPDELFPMGDIEPIETQQLEVDKLETLQYTHSKRFIQKYTAVKGALDDKMREQVASPDNVLVEVNAETNLKALENPSVNQTIPITTATVKQEMQKIDGVSEYDTSVLPDKNRTLGEAQLVQSGANNRKEDARKDVEQFMKRIFRKLGQVVQQYMTDEFMLQITGDGSQVSHWAKVSPESIQGEFDYDIEPSSALPVNKPRIRQDTMLLYNTLVADPTLPLPAKNELRKWLLEAFDKTNVEPFMSQPMPVAQPGLPGAMGGQPGVMPPVSAPPPPGLPGLRPPVARPQPVPSPTATNVFGGKNGP